MWNYVVSALRGRTGTHAVFRLFFSRDAGKTSLICPAVYHEHKTSCAQSDKVARGIQQRPTGNRVTARQADGETLFSHKNCRNIIALDHVLFAVLLKPAKRMLGKKTHTYVGSSACSDLVRT